MAEQGALRRKSTMLAGAAVFGSAAMVMSIAFPARVQPPFPWLPFLRFDPTEIPAFLAFLIFGPVAGVLTALVHYLLLLAQTTRGPLGPSLKFAAIVASMLGLWMGSALVDRASRHSRITTAFGSMFVFAAVSRLAFTTVLNLVVFTSLGPLFGIDYIGTSQKAMALSLGLTLTSPYDVLVYALVLAGAYNLIQLVVSALPAFALITPLVVKLPELASGGTWLARYTTKPLTKQVSAS